MTITLHVAERNRTMQDTVKLELNNREVLCLRIREALDRMPERLREVFVLTHYRALPEGAIARRLGIQQPELETLVWTANSAFHRALRNS